MCALHVLLRSAGDAGEKGDKGDKGEDGVGIKGSPGAPGAPGKATFPSLQNGSSKCLHSFL